jgi:putative aldouronate transport system substrate-binding protein
MKKKKLGIILASVLAAGTLLSACSSKDSATSEKSGKNGAPYEIKWYTIGTPQKDT